MQAIISRVCGQGLLFTHCVRLCTHMSMNHINKEPTSMSESKDKTIALNVRLKPSEPSAHPRATNYTNVGGA